MLLRYAIPFSLISSKSQYRKAFNTSFKTYYIFSIKVGVCKFILVTCYSIEHKKIYYIHKMTKVITSLWWKNFPFQAFWMPTAAALVRDSEKKWKPDCQSNGSRPFTILYVCIKSSLVNINDIMHKILSLSLYGKS